jgi:LacI family transcriptional regulator
MNTIYKVLLLIDFSEAYGRGILRGIAKYAQFFGPWMFCRMPIYHRSEGDMEEIVKWAEQWGANGIVAHIYNEDEARQLIQSGIPVIAQDSIERFNNIPNITGLYRETGRMAAEHFLHRGFTKFAFYGFENIVWSRERLEGFSQQIVSAGYETLIYQHPKQEKTNLWSYKASPLSEWLKSLPKPIAIMASDDNQGQQVLEACKITGINVPEQVAIIGVDNDEVVCNLSEPPLSSISLNTEKAGYETAQLMHKMMDSQKLILQNIYVEPMHIITRRSSDIFAIEDKELAKALQFIYYNYKEPIQVDDVVKATLLSRRVLEKRFAEVLGKTILEEINSLRIEHVSKMLVETNFSISEIASLSGYADERNLSRFFKSRKQISPLAYRKNFSIGK